ncbi:hypothetical protein ABIC75_002027 [Dyella japonica]|uniref:Uncharacterized protein n=1 Tax=Dyella japonica TaxID=231455 RepID=A0ABV2JTZ0_9GAMM
MTAKMSCVASKRVQDVALDSTKDSRKEVRGCSTRPIYSKEASP